MNFAPERLISLRESMGINKAEVSRRLNMSAMDTEDIKMVNKNQNYFY